MNDRAGEIKLHRWRVLGKVVLFMFGCAVVLAVAAPLVPELAGRWPELVLGTIASLWAFALTVVFVRWDRLNLADVGAAPRWRSLPRFVVGFSIGLLLVGLCSSVSLVAGYVRWVRVPETGLAATTVGLIAYLALSCREELAFRGYPLRRLERPCGIWGAQLLVALVFAAEHRLGGSTWTQALLGPGVGSLLFGMAAIATRGLAVPIGLHAAWNFGQWTLGLKGEPGLWNAVVKEGSEGHAELVGTISFLVVVGSATLVFWLWHIRLRQVFTLQDHARIE